MAEIKGHAALEKFTGALAIENRFRMMMITGEFDRFRIKVKTDGDARATPLHRIHHVTAAATNVDGVFADKIFCQTHRPNYGALAAVLHLIIRITRTLFRRALFAV